MRERRVVEDGALAERRVREHRDLLAPANFHDGVLLVADVRLRFVDGRPNLTEREQPFQLRRADVAHA